MGYLRFLFRVAGFALITLFCKCCFFVEIIFRRGKPKIDVINRWVPIWSRMNLWLFGIQVQRDGEFVSEGKLYPGKGENAIGRIFVANHRSGLDIPILFSTAETHVISRHDLATWPLIGSGARLIGTLFVDRESRKSGASVLKEVDKSLQRGEGVAMFPEGTAHKGDEVRNFRQGAFNSALRADAEVVPIGIAYDNEAAYYGEYNFMEHIKNVAFLRRLRVAVEVGEPMKSVDFTNVEMKESARKQVQELVNRARQKLSNS